MSELNTIKTFAKLVSEYGIEIPLIQRDYVQGRVHDVEELAGKTDEAAKSLRKKYIAERERRDGFVKQLLNALENPDENSIALTFIYGNLQEINANPSRHRMALVPLDGQQRLTTLFLLSWLLICKQTAEDLDILMKRTEFENLRKGLESFSYKTRPSSGVFCSLLMTETLCGTGERISVLLRNQPWFGDEWMSDPSVKAMLQMLDKLEECFEGRDLKRMLENLLDGRGIVFDLLDMKDYKLTDGLYIKMNGRGKQLTEFENWKSEFIGFLEERHRGLLYNGVINEDVKNKVFGGKTPSYKDYFAHAIEHQWTDLFWKYCKEKICAHIEDRRSKGTISKREQDCYPVVDNFFMRVFEKLTRICFYVTNPDKTDAGDFTLTKELRDRLYGNQENVKKLFEFLDVLSSFNHDIFEDLFYVSADNQSTLQNGRVRLFDNKSVNLLDRCALNEDATAESDTLLYSLVKYVKEFGPRVDADMKSFVRCIRNNIEGRRFLRTGDRSMSPDYFIHKIQTEEYRQPSVVDLIDDLIAQKRDNGCLKRFTDEESAIEDFDFVRGNRRLVQKIAGTGIPVTQIYNVLKVWDSLGNLEKQQLLIAYGFVGHRTSYCNHGALYLWGGKNNWEPIFVHDDGMNNGNIEAVITQLLNDVCRLSGVGDKVALQKLLEEKKNSVTQFDFRYYALIYTSFLTAHAYGKESCCFIAARGENGLEDLDLISAIYSSKPTLAYHTDPIVFALKEKLIATSQDMDSPSRILYLAYSTTGADRADLRVYNAPNGVDGPVARLVHKAGKHGTGGWLLRLSELGNGDKLFNDEEKKDRIQAGFEIVNAEFPHSQFKERE